MSFKKDHIAALHIILPDIVHREKKIVFMVLPDMSRILSACFVNTDCYNGISNLSPPFIRLPDCSMYSYVYLVLKRGEKIRQIAYLRNVFCRPQPLLANSQKLSKSAKK